jgi:hypothetical protein
MVLHDMSRLSITSAVLCDRALPCSVRASLPMPFTAAQALLPALFTSTGSLPLCLQDVVFADLWSSKSSYGACRWHSVGSLC